MPPLETAGRQFLTALDDLCNGHQFPAARGQAVALELVGEHLCRMAALPKSGNATTSSPFASAVTQLLTQFKWSLSEACTPPGHLSPLLLQTLFEGSLDGDVRRQRGIVYTPEKTVRTVVDAALLELDRTSAAPLRIADPATGSGAFLVHLAGRRALSAELVGLEPDPAALAVAKTRLRLLQTVTAPPHPAIHLTVGLAQNHLPASSHFDLVIGNPPYVRHEERQASSRHLCQQLATALGLESKDGRVKRLVTGRADLYATFFLLAMAAVRPGGVVAFVTSDSWLDARFGEDLQSIALALCDRIVLYPENTRRSFLATGVNTVITVLRRRQGPGDTSLRVATTAAGAHPGPATSPTPGKWAARFLRAGPASRRLQEHPLMVPLGSLARLTYGNKPGIRPFFVLPAPTAPLLVDRQFLRPILASAKEIWTYDLPADGLRHQLFVCPFPMDELRRRGHQLTVSWIERGAQQMTLRGARHTRGGVPWPEVQSVGHNRPEWHCLTLRPSGDFVIPSLLGNRLFVAHNSARVDNTNAFFHGSFHRDIDPLLGLGLLNSSVSYLLFETYGRPKGLGGLNLYGPELRTMPIIDPRKLTLTQRRGIIEAFSAMRRRQILPLVTELGGGNQDLIPEDRRALDSLLFDALGWSSIERTTAYEELLAMTSHRLQKGRK